MHYNIISQSLVFIILGLDIVDAYYSPNSKSSPSPIYFS
jgi:hypothetical protein